MKIDNIMNKYLVNEMYMGKEEMYQMFFDDYLESIDSRYKTPSAERKAEDIIEKWLFGHLSKIDWEEKEDHGYIPPTKKVRSVLNKISKENAKNKDIQKFQGMLKDKKYRVTITEILAEYLWRSKHNI
jgi:hypothetical protein